MDIETIKKLLADNLPEESAGDTVKKVPDQKMIVLSVSTLEDGLKKAASLFDVDIEEIEYRYLDKAASSEGNRRIEFKQKQISGETVIVVSEDGLKAVIPELFPKLPEGTGITPEYIYEIAEQMSIQSIDKDRIVKSVSMSIQNRKILKNIIVAEGTPPEQGKPSKIIKGIIGSLEDIDYLAKNKKTLSNLFALESVQEIGENAFDVYFVDKDHEILVASLPGEGKPGTDVYGNKIESQSTRNTFTCGKGVRFEFMDQTVVYKADYTGYLELNKDSISVFSPVRISEDKMSAQFIILPQLNDKSLIPSTESLNDLLSGSGIEAGIKETYAKEIAECLEKNPRDFTFCTVAEGSPPDNGRDSRVELFFSKEDKPGVLREDGSMDFHERERLDQVKVNQLLAVKYPATEGKEGISVTGVTEPAKPGIEKSFEGMNNVKTVTSEGKTTFYSQIQGIVDLIGDIGISVNKHYDVEGDVDLNTGNIVFDGNIHIKGSVQSGFNVIADGNVLIDGSIGQKVTIESGGNITVREGIVGKRDIVIRSKGSLYAKFIQGAILEVDGDVIVQESIINSEVKAKGGVFTPSKSRNRAGKGSIIESDIESLGTIAANIAGSEISKNTKLVSGSDYTYDSKMKDLQKAKSYCDFEITKISKTLRLGINDAAKIKMLIKKLPAQKQKPFIESFKKLVQYNGLRGQILEKIQLLQEGSESLVKEARVFIRQNLFPNVLIQIGDKRIKTEKNYKNVSVSFSDEKNNLLIIEGE